MLPKFRSHARHRAGPVTGEHQRSRRYRVAAAVMVVLAAAIALATGWSSAVADSIGKAFATNGSANSAPVQGQRADESGNNAAGRGLDALPNPARGPVSGALGRGDPAYRIGHASSGLVATNGPQRLRASFGAGGVQLRSGRAHLGLAARGLGYGDARRRHRGLTPTASPTGAVGSWSGTRTGRSGSSRAPRWVRARRPRAR